MGKPETVTVECGGTAYLFRLSDWRRFVRAQTLAEAKWAVRKECVAIDAGASFSKCCEGCRLDEQDHPCRDPSAHLPSDANWTGPRDPERCAELLRLKGASR